MLNEIGYRGAALPHGANYNAMMSKLQNGDKNALSKMDVSNQSRIYAITQSIKDNFPSLQLHFIERDKANQFYSVSFTFLEMSVLNDDRFVRKGNVAISSKKEKAGYIEFSFQQQSFYRVNFYGGGSIRRIYPLMLDNDYKELFKSFLTFITNIGYSEKDYENNVDVNGPSMSKKHALPKTKLTTQTKQ
ncbi:MAG: hypothetical protein K6E93_01475 [Bacteroidales bacterium]|nr:hypothetical protein [Bacteroidales bacterium]